MCCLSTIKSMINPCFQTKHADGNWKSGIFKQIFKDISPHLFFDWFLFTLFWIFYSACFMGIWGGLLHCGPHKESMTFVISFSLYEYSSISMEKNRSILSLIHSCLIPIIKNNFTKSNKWEKVSLIDFHTVTVWVNAFFKFFHYLKI